MNIFFLINIEKNPIKDKILFLFMHVCMYIHIYIYIYIYVKCGKLFPRKQYEIHIFNICNLYKFLRKYAPPVAQR